MQYAPGGDLHNWLQKEFADITWNKKKLAILWQISEGLETIHKADYIHRDFHSGNILYDLSSIKRHQWLIGDLGLSQPADNTSSNNEIYGVIPYVAPEIFRGSAFSKETDVYCMESQKLGPEFAKKPHPRAIYTSRPLSFFISKCSSINSSKDYISRELEFDISIESYTSRSLSVPVTSLGKRNIEELNIEETNNDRGKHVKLVHRNIE
ncbi:unnamed protein product [Rhizophagus irregularis]|nr:unnamed protein product [Rhizophagus irregularis]